MLTLPNASARYIDCYITDRRQRVKINSIFHEQKKVNYNVPPRSILGLLLCNKFICDPFFDNKDIATVSYTDDTKTFASHQET